MATTKGSDMAGIAFCILSFLICIATLNSRSVALKSERYCRGEKPCCCRNMPEGDDESHEEPVKKSTQGGTSGHQAAPAHHFPRVLRMVVRRSQSCWSHPTNISQPRTVRDLMS